MPTRNSKYLIIDASIARSAGGEQAVHPISKYCRDFLKEVLTICHRAVITPDIKEEWDKHQSIFFGKWRTEMVAKKKIKYMNLPSSNLRQIIEGSAKNYKNREAMWKDCFLLEAALANDKIVISTDEIVRNLFSQISPEVREIKMIAWVNPTIVDEKPIEWLKEGANLDPERMLGYYR